MLRASQNACASPNIEDQAMSNVFKTMSGKSVSNIVVVVEVKELCFVRCLRKLNSVDYYLDRNLILILKDEALKLVQRAEW